MKIFPFKALHPNLDNVASPDVFFSSAKLQFIDYKENGFYDEKSGPALYVYEIIEDGIRHLGLLASVDVDDYSNGKILIHEHTLLEKEQQFMDLFLERKAMIKPIMLTHSPSDELQQVMEAVIAEQKETIAVRFDADDSQHKFWRITDQAEISALSEVFHRVVRHAYIADGHHRSRATERLHKMVVKREGGLSFNRIFCGLFACNQLKIREFNRILSVLNVVSPSLIMARLSAICEIEPLEEITLPQSPREMTMLLKNEAYALRWKEDVLAEYKDDLILDAVLFNELICRDICGIKDIRTDSRIQYIKGAHGIEEVERKTNYREDIAFFLYPITFEEFKYCSDNKIILPPKTTYFTPRMKNGVVVQLINKH